MPLMGVAVTEDLIPHPNNYVEHPQDQIDHLKTSLVNFGFYRNIVVANENYIIAGHGVWLAAKELGMEHVPIVKMEIDPFSPEALKLLIGDNEVRHLVVTDDRGLADMMIDLTEEGGDLKGTGWDQMMLANFVLITRDKDEIQDLEHSRHWIGLPGYERVFRPLSMTIHTRNAEDRAKVLELLGLQGAKITKRMVLWWPPLASQQPMDLKFMPESLVQQSNGDADVEQDPASPATEVTTDDAPVIAAENVRQVADPGEPDAAGFLEATWPSTEALQEHLADQPVVAAFYEEDAEPPTNALETFNESLQEALSVQSSEKEFYGDDADYEDPNDELTDGELGEPEVQPDVALTPEDEEGIIVPESTGTEHWNWRPFEETEKEEPKKPDLFGAVPADRYTS